MSAKPPEVNPANTDELRLSIFGQRMYGLELALLGLVGQEAFCSEEDLMAKNLLERVEPLMSRITRPSSRIENGAVPILRLVQTAVPAPVDSFLHSLAITISQAELLQTEQVFNQKIEALRYGRIPTMIGSKQVNDTLTFGELRANASRLGGHSEPDLNELLPAGVEFASVERAVELYFNSKGIKYDKKSNTQNQITFHLSNGAYLYIGIESGSSKKIRFISGYERVELRDDGPQKQAILEALADSQLLALSRELFATSTKTAPKLREIALSSIDNTSKALQENLPQQYSKITFDQASPEARRLFIETFNSAANSALPGLTLYEHTIHNTQTTICLELAHDAQVKLKNEVEESAADGVFQDMLLQLRRGVAVTFTKESLLVQVRKWMRHHDNYLESSINNVAKNLLSRLLPENVRQFQQSAGVLRFSEGEQQGLEVSLKLQTNLSDYRVQLNATQVLGEWSYELIRISK